MTTVETNGIKVRGMEGDLLVIERLASALEKAASIDEIKDVRDRAMAIQLYARKKAGGLIAAQAAGRVVTDATLRLTELHAKESKRKVPGPGRGKKASDSGPIVLSPGREAIAEAAELDGSQLRRLRPLIEAPKTAVKAAERAIESRGDVVTPNALLREVTATSASSSYDGDEWYTPPEFLTHVRDVLDEIDLDPASNTFAQKTVDAKKYYTKQDNGLKQPWKGRIFCNPPYSMPLIEQFAEKLIAEVDLGHCVEAIYLVNSSTDVGWFHLLLDRFPVCLTRGRISFLTRQGQKFANRQGQAIFYFGRKRQRFEKVFGELGVVLSKLQ